MKRINFVLMMIILIVSLSAFQKNEELTFTIKYGFIKAATSVLSIQEDTFRDSIPVYKITAESKTNSFFDHLFKVRDYIESIWDRRLRVSRKFSKKLKEGNYRQYRIHYYSPQHNFSMYMKYRWKKKKFKRKRMEIPDSTQDMLSALFYLRMQNFAVGDSIPINVTVDGDSYIAVVDILRKEKIETIFGETECFVIKPKLKGEAIFNQKGDIYIWITADEHKIPVRLESKIIFGKFKAILRDAKNVAYKKK